MTEQRYISVPGADGWNNDMTHAEVNHMLGKGAVEIRPGEGSGDSLIESVGSIAVSRTYFEEHCPVNPTPHQIAQMLRAQLNPDAGAAVQKFQERSKEF